MTDKKYKSVPVNPSEITPEHLYLSRRKFMKIAGVAGVAAALAACGVKPGSAPASGAGNNAVSGQTIEPTPADVQTPDLYDELGDPANSYKDITNFNNFYEFTTNKEQVAELAKDFKTSPWEFEVSGLVNNPRTFSMEDVLKCMIRRNVFIACVV